MRPSAGGADSSGGLSWLVPDTAGYGEDECGVNDIIGDVSAMVSVAAFAVMSVVSIIQLR